MEAIYIGATLNPLFIPKETKDELNKLSKELFGRKTKWLKILRNGLPRVVEYSSPTRLGKYPRPLKSEVLRFTPISLLEHLKSLKVSFDNLKAGTPNEAKESIST